MRLIFPTGRHHHAPSDRLDHQVAKILQVPSATRSRIGRGQYLTPSEHNPVGLLEEALLEVMAADPIHQRICKELGKNLPFTRLDELAHNALAKGLISQDEAAILKIPVQSIAVCAALTSTTLRQRSWRQSR